MQSDIQRHSGATADTLRIEPEKAYGAIRLLCEGVGVRAIERLTGLNRRTVLNILATSGEKSARLMDERVRNHPFETVQVDELFCFIKMKERLNVHKCRDIGDQYVFLGVDAASKFIINHMVGKRDTITADEYIFDLKKRVKTPFQLTTDGFTPYLRSVFQAFYGDVHFAQLIKQYANFKDGHKGERRYSPSQCIGTKKLVHIGNPNPELISTSYVERTNLSVRLFNRRFTRLTLGYSKTLQNLKHSVALFIAHFNFCRAHSAHGKAVTPAMACGLADHVWTVEELLQPVDSRAMAV